MINSTTLGIYLGIACSVVYLIFHAIKKKKPNLSHVAVIILSATAITVSLELGKVALMASTDELGILKEQRVPMVLGAIAVVWTSIESVFDIYKPLLVMNPIPSASQTQTNPNP